MKSLGATTAVLVLLTAAPAAAVAAGGTGNGGASYGGSATPKPKSSPAARPALTAFAITPSVLTPGQTPAATVQVKGRAPTIRLRLVVSWPGTANPQRTIDLGRVRANTRLHLALPQLADPSLSEGIVSVRIAGRDSSGRILRPAAHLSRVAQIQVRGHVFPLRGQFSYGDAADRFGAVRDGHTHQGQDLLAAEGTPVVAPRAGTITYVGYQASAAGYYVVLDGDGEDLNYVFMHLQKDSIPVVAGQHVDMGQRIGSVGHTGDAQGSHLHFEVWQGPWWGGGHAVDPLPYLQQWQPWSPVTAT